MHDIVLQRAAQNKATLLPGEQGYPQLVQTGNLSIVEFGFLKEGETHSIQSLIRLELSGFGEIIKLNVPLSIPLSPEAIQELKGLCAKAQWRISNDRVGLTLQLLEDTPKREKQVAGLLIMGPSGHLLSIVAPVR